MSRTTLFGLALFLMVAAAHCVRAGASEGIYLLVAYLVGPATLAALLQRDS